MLSRTFIDRPVFAWVIAIVIMLAGIGGILSLPIEQYPDIAPPSINIRATYPGASAETLESSVTEVIEQQLTGIDGLLYFSATSNSSGQVRITVTLEKGVNPDIAQVQVQNKVQQALPRLPQQVQRQGLVVTKANADFLMVVALFDTSGRMSSADVSDYLVSNLQDDIARLPGVGDTSVFGAPYAIRVWLDPARLASFKLMPSDIISAIEAQNAQVAAGEIGGQPAAAGQMLNATVTARSRLTTPEQFRNILVKTSPNGARVRLQDVARVELGSENYTNLGRIDGHPGAGVSIMLAPGADALRTARQVKALVDSRAASFPAGLQHLYPNDSTDFIKLSIEEVVKTLGAAILLVVIVMFCFLQSWRATLIPAIAVPVVMLGTLGILAVAGFSINTLTMFALVLSIGLLVDDAIVVVENVERIMAEHPTMSPRDATIQSMAEIQTALVAIALVLSAVFLPMAFFGGSVGVIYRQFSITIVSSMVLSAVVALILSPALAATLLRRPDPAKARAKSPLLLPLQSAGNRFNNWFRRTADRYLRAVARLMNQMKRAALVYAGILILLGLIFWWLPSSFLPSEDQGVAQLQFTLPPGATQQRTLAAAIAIEDYFAKAEPDNVLDVFSVIGQNQAGAGQNAGRGFLKFAPWDERHGKDNAAEAITRRANKALGASLRDVQFFALNPPPVRGLGQSSGFTVELLNTGNLSRVEFKKRSDELMTAASADPGLTAVRLNALEDTPTLKVEIDPERVGALGLNQADVDDSLSAAWGGVYVNDFIDRGRVKRVYVQGDAQYRARPEDISGWFVRSSTGDMVPFSAFATTSWSEAPSALVRFNGVPAYEFQGQAAEGRSSGQAMDRIAAIAADLPGVSIAWSGLSYQERLSGSQAPALYAVSALVVFLCLAALYESWSIPMAVMLIIPLGLAGAALAALLRGLDNDIFFQVGLLTTMGLAAKNAILIVEFAEHAERTGKSALDAAMAGARLRLRPILMTSFAFIFGVIPLAISTGAGAHSRIAIGTAVIGGVLSATFMALFYTPLLFVLVRRWFGHAGPPVHREIGS